jgi:hypothetical protein
VVAMMAGAPPVLWPPGWLQADNMMMRVDAQTNRWMIFTRLSLLNG